VVEVGPVRFGDGGFVLIGGPCAIESATQIDTIAAAVSAAGGAMLRGGAYKPRTSPYDFQGLGADALPLINEAAQRSGLPAVVEVLAEAQVALMAAYVDMLQIGARNMQNVPLLRAAARSGMPILVKRGAAATLDEILFAAEYILLEGNERVILCERGIRGFDPQTRNVCDLGGAIRLKELTHLPVILDPSHASGRRSMIEPLTLAAAAAGLDGAIVETHPEPDASRSDAAQAIDLPAFARLAARVRAVRAALDEGQPALEARIATARGAGVDRAELIGDRPL
jgi:3-deoxy-7-phosphoheptulonate synthase